MKRYDSKLECTDWDQYEAVMEEDTKGDYVLVSDVIATLQKIVLGTVRPCHILENFIKELE